MNFLIRSAMRALMPRTEKLPGIDDADLNRFIKQLRAETTPWYFLGLIIGAVIFAITPLLTVGIPLPAFMLPPKALDRHAAKILSTNIYFIRTAVLIVRLNAGLCWGRDNKVRAIFHLKPYSDDPGTWRTQ
jgi:hypothetical protein